MSSIAAQHGQVKSLRIESLEPRILLAGDTYLINFQLAGASTPTRYIADVGDVFGPRNGLNYGWSSDHTDVSRDRGIALDQRLDTLIHFHQGQVWELALPNGRYEVTVGIGDAQHPSIHTLNVEGANYWNQLSLTPGDFRERSLEIDVNDGRLTLDQGTAIEKATRIDFVHVVGVPGAPNTMPAAPVITEPATDDMVLNPSDVHMEAVGYFDADGDAHKSSDWQIWTVGPGAEPVWQTLGIGGVERLHTHLGDGNFINSHAGRFSLLPDSEFELRVRFRDDVGSVSEYATRPFETAAASEVFPLALQDVGPLSASYWRTPLGVNVILAGASPVQSEVRLESAGGESLLRLAGLNGVSNAITNPPPLATVADVRVVVAAGSNSLNLPASNLRVLDESGIERIIYMPAVNIAAGQRLDIWVSSTGSTYYGTAAQSEPDFANLARAGDAVFTALKPGFVVEDVAGGFQLPVNIAFVPNPGPNPDDPLFYVNELYGSIKVVTRDYSVSDYATNLLNFNPTGAFPGSGEQGLAGIVVDPASGDLFVTRVTSSVPGVESAPHYPQVVRLSSSDGGRTASSITVIRDMVGETMGQSHQISNITIGPDGKLYVHVGDGFDYTTAQNLNSYRGKILRMNLDGSAPADNPFYNLGNGINSADYVFAYGVRNPFGGAWRASDGAHYEVENGPSVDRLARIDRGVNYGWNNTNASMTINAIYNWSPSHAPVNIDFIQSTTFAGSQFPVSMLDHAFVSESGPTYAAGPQTRGKRIVEFVIDASGNLDSGPTTLVEYTGVGRGTVSAIAAGPDGLYFSELYKDLNAASPIEAGARIFRVRYVNPIVGDYDINGSVDESDIGAWSASYGSNLLLGADGNRNGVVDAADYVLWRKNLAASAAAGSGSSAAIVEPDAVIDYQSVAPGAGSVTEATNSRAAAFDRYDPSGLHQRFVRFAGRGHRPSAESDAVARLTVDRFDNDLLAVLADDTYSVRESEAVSASRTSGGREAIDGELGELWHSWPAVVGDE